MGGLRQPKSVGGARQATILYMVAQNGGLARAYPTFMQAASTAYNRLLTAKAVRASVCSPDGGAVAVSLAGCDRPWMTAPRPRKRSPRIFTCHRGIVRLRRCRRDISERGPRIQGPVDRSAAIAHLRDRADNRSAGHPSRSRAPPRPRPVGAIP